MNIAPTCPKCLRPYWDDGSQTAVTVCSCNNHAISPPSLVLHSDTYMMQLLKEINSKLDELKAIQVQAKVKPACEQLERDIKCLLVDVETQLSKCPYGKPRRLLLYMQEQIKAILTEYESKSV